MKLLKKNVHSFKNASQLFHTLKLERCCSKSQSHSFSLIVEKVQAALIQTLSYNYKI